MKAFYGPHLIALAATFPQKALEQLRELITEARRNGDHERLHACEDMFVAVAGQARLATEEAVAIAERLLTELRDSTHLRVVARLYEAQGKLPEARQLLAEADSVKDQHIDATGERILQALFGNRPPG